MYEPQPPFDHEPEFWAYNDVHVEQDKLAHILVHHEAWCPTAPRSPATPYNVELVRAYARHALEHRPRGQWCVRFGRGNEAPSIWPCDKKRPA